MTPTTFTFNSGQQRSNEGHRAHAAMGGVLRPSGKINKGSFGSWEVKYSDVLSGNWRQLKTVKEISLPQNEGQS